MDGSKHAVGVFPLFEAMAVLGDPVRSRLLRLLEAAELSVSDLCAVLQLPQSTVSRHLKTLGDGGWVESRALGTRRLYRAQVDRQDDASGGLWELTRERLALTEPAQGDDARLASVLAQARSRSREFFDNEASRWDTVRDELFGGRTYLHALMGLLDAGWTVGDLGCGTGPVSEALAPFVEQVIAVDGSAPMLEQATQRLRRFDNVELRRGDLESLPIDNRCLDVATLCLVLHHVARPPEVLAEAARATRPGGRLLVVDMQPHDREDYRQEMGHVWLGFGENTLREWVAPHFDQVRCVALPPAPRAKGPNLFVLHARRRNHAPLNGPGSRPNGAGPAGRRP